MPISKVEYDKINETFKRLKHLYNTDVFDSFIDDLIPYEIIRRLSNNNMFDDDDKKVLRDLYKEVMANYTKWGDDCEY